MVLRDRRGSHEPADASSGAHRDRRRGDREFRRRVRPFIPEPPRRCPPRVVSALCAVGIGFVLERPPIIVIGALGFFMFDFRAFAVYLHSASTALGAFILGLALIVVALLWTRHAARQESREVETRSDVSVTVEWYEPR